MRGSGGTEGGTWLFFVGLAMSVAGLYFFFDTVRVVSGIGLFGGLTGGRQTGGGGMGMRETTSMGILFVPFLAAVVALFYDARRKWAWWLLYVGVGVIAIEALSRIRLVFETKLTLLLMMLGLFAAGIGLMLRSYRDQSAEKT
jgi:hypothetical protein